MTAGHRIALWESAGQGRYLGMYENPEKPAAVMIQPGRYAAG